MQKPIKGLQINNSSAVPPEFIPIISVGGAAGVLQILVFKTNLTDLKRISDISSSLDIHPHIIQWNVDLHDCDNVLRIVSKNVEAKEIEQLVLGAGYYCEELQ